MELSRREMLGSCIIGGGTFLLGGFSGFWAGEQVYLDKMETVRAGYASDLKNLRDENTFAETVSREGQRFTLSPGEYNSFGIEEPEFEPRRLTYEMVSDLPVDVLVMDVDEFEKYADGDGASADSTSSSLATTHGTGRTRFERAITLVVDYTTDFEAVPAPSPTRVDLSLEIEV